MGLHAYFGNVPDEDFSLLFEICSAADAAVV
jgi:hypothetical protein